MAKDYYFKVKLKDRVTVTGTSAIRMPLSNMFTPSHPIKWMCGSTVPSSGKLAKKIDKELAENGAIGNISDKSQNLSTYLHQKANGVYGSFDTFEVNDFLTEKLTPEAIFQDSFSEDVTLLNIFKFWNPVKFSDFILETLVGKSIKHALLYGYFGYPIVNIGDFLGRSGNKEEESELIYSQTDVGNNYTYYQSGWSGISQTSLGYMSPFGSSDNNQITAQQFDYAKGPESAFTLEPPFYPNNFLTNAIINQLAGSAFAGANRFFGETSYVLSEFSSTCPRIDIPNYNFENARKFYFNPYKLGSQNTEGIYADNGHPDFMGGLGPEVYFTEGLMELESTTKHWSEALLRNSYLTLEYMGIAPNSDTGIKILENQSPLGWNENFSHTDQQLTPTHARMWMPGLNTSTNSKITNIIGGKEGLFNSMWYKNFYEPPETSAQYNKSFKFTNMVSALKLVPYGISDDNLAYYLDNPHETLNQVAPKVIEYVARVVPYNIRNAGPKPATSEPFHPALPKQTKPEACEMPSNYQEWVTQRILTGSFFEMCSIPPVMGVPTEESFNYFGEYKKINDEFSSGDPGFLSDSGITDTKAHILSRVRFNKGLSDLFLYNNLYEKFYYTSVGDETEADIIGIEIGGYENQQLIDGPDNIDPAVLLYGDSSTVYDPRINKWGQSRIDYGYKFGLPVSYFIGHRNKDKKDPILSPASVSPNTLVKGNVPLQFMLVPQSPQTIRSMIDSLPHDIRKNLGLKAVPDWNIVPAGDVTAGKGVAHSNWEMPYMPYWQKNEDNVSVYDPVERTRYITNLWLTYHFASIPANFYLNNSAGAFLLKENIIDGPHNSFEFEVDFYEPEGSNQIQKGDYQPLILQDMSTKKGKELLYSYMPSSQIQLASKAGNAVTYQGITGYEHNEFLNNWLYLFGDYRDVGEDAWGTILQDTSLLLDAGVVKFFKASNDVPYRVRHKSKLLFPVWNYQEDDLKEINWPNVIYDDQQDSQEGLNLKSFNEEIESLNDGVEDESQKSKGWQQYVEANPNVLKKIRKCIPDWCTGIQVYPTISKDYLKFGLVGNVIEIQDAMTGYPSYLHNELPIFAGGYGEVSQIDFDDRISPNHKQSPYNADGLPLDGTLISLEKKAKPYISIKFQYDTTNNLGQHVYSTTLDDNDPAIDLYRRPIGYAELAYAADLQIDEKKLFLDMVKFRVFALAGTGEEYKEAGFKLGDIFAVADEDSIKDAGLLEDFRIWKKSQEADLPSIVFENIPNFLKGTNVNEELKELLSSDAKQEELKDKYLDLTNNDENKCLATSIILVNGGEGPSGSPSARSIFRVAPGTRADTVAGVPNGIPNLTLIRVLKEWVNGTGEPAKDFNYIEVVDPDSELNGLKGYVAVADLIPVKSILKHFDFKDDIFFSSYIKTPAGTQYKDLININFSDPQNGALVPAELKDQFAVRQLTQGQIISLPLWWNLSEPYYHAEDAEFWHSVELPDVSCILDDQDLELRKGQAQAKGIEELLNFYSKNYTTDQIQLLTECCLATRVEDYYIDLQPGVGVKFLLKVGGIYLNAFPDSQISLAEAKEQSTKILSLDTRYYVRHLAQANFGLNKMYNDIVRSDYRVEGINFVLEADRMDYIPSLLKKLISLNNYKLDFEKKNLINIGFDDNFNIVFVSYNEGVGENREKLLRIGFDYIKNQEPFNVPNTMSLFYYHRQLKNPLLKWEYAIEEYFVDPKPRKILKEDSTIPDIPSTNCKPPRFTVPTLQEFLGPLAAQLDDALQLDPRFDLGSFQFSLTDFLPPCPKPPSGKGPIYFKGEIETMMERSFYEGDFGGDWGAEALTRMLNYQTDYKDYVGDFMGSGEALRDSMSKIFTKEDLYDLFLRKTGGLPGIYEKVCRCFLDLAGLQDLKVPNFSIDLQGPEAGLNIKPLSYIPGIAPDAPANTSITGGKKAGWNEGDEYELDGGSFGSYQKFKDSFSTDPTVIDAGDLICSFCLEVPSFLLRLPSTNIMDILIDALLKALEFILAQLLLQIVAALLDLLLQCPELSCPEGEGKVKDYGAQNLNDIMSRGFGGVQTTPDELFELCGLVVDGAQVTTEDVQFMLEDISKVLSSGDVLKLFDGSLSRDMILIVQRQINNYSGIANQLKNTAQIRDFFRCLGFKIEPEALGEIEDEIIEKYQNPDICNTIFDDAKKKLQEKCGIVEDQQKIIQDATEADVQKYKDLANLIREIPDLTKQIPPIFSDNKGNKGVLSGLSNPTIDWGIKKTIENVFISTEQELVSESKKFYDPRSKVMVKRSQNKIDVLENTIRGNSFFYAPIMSTLSLIFIGGPIGAAVGAALFAVHAGASLIFDDRSPLVGNFFPMKDTDAPQPNHGYNSVPSFKQVLEKLNEPQTEDNDVKINISTNKVEILIDSYESLDSNSDIPGTKSTAAQFEIDGARYIESKIKFSLLFNKPDKKDNAPIYNNNYQIKTKAKSILDSESEVTIFPSANKDKNISPTLELLLSQYSLEDNEQPPQAQYYGNLLTDKSISGAGFDSDTENTFYDIFSNELYYAQLTSVITGMAESVANSEMLMDYQVNLFDQIDGNSNGFVLFMLTLCQDAASLVTTGTVGEVNSPTYEKEMGRFSIAPHSVNVDGKTFTKGLIDLERVYNVTKQNYDFANYSDPNSEEMGMPHYALLSGVISSMMQLVIGELLARSIVSFSKFPETIYEDPDDSLVEFMYKSFNSFLEAEEDDDSPSIKYLFNKVIKYLISQRSDYVFKNESDPDPYNPPSLEKFYPGSITDNRTGIIYPIEGPKDAIKFYIRKEIPVCVKFLSDKLSLFNKGGAGGHSGQNFDKIGLMNPLDIISYNKPLYVHDEVHNSSVDALGTSAAKMPEDPSPYDLPSSLYDNERYRDFLNGKFFFQMYYKIEDLEPGDENYREDIANRPSRLKNILSQDNMFELIKRMSGNELGTKTPLDWASINDPGIFQQAYQFLHEQSDIDGDIAFKDFFKSIKFGMRLCFAFIRSDVERSGTGGAIVGFEEQDAAGEAYKPYSEGQLPIFKTISDQIDSLVLGDAANEEDGTYHHKIKDEIRDYIELTKSLVITEDDDDANNNMTKNVLKTYLFPILEKNIDIKDNSNDDYNFVLFDENPTEVAYRPELLREFLFKDQGPLIQEKCLTEIALSDEYLALFKYSFFIPQLVVMFTLMNMTVVSVDPKVRKAFKNTKKSLRTLFTSVTEMVGPEKYKKVGTSTAQDSSGNQISTV